MVGVGEGLLRPLWGCNWLSAPCQPKAEARSDRWECNRDAAKCPPVDTGRSSGGDGAVAIEAT